MGSPLGPVLEAVAQITGVIADHLQLMPPLFQPPAEVRHTASIATELLWRVEIGDQQQPHQRRQQAIGFLFKSKAPVGNLPALITSGDLLPGGGR